jgi:hypothetical protein
MAKVEKEKAIVMSSWTSTLLYYDNMVVSVGDINNVRYMLRKTGFILKEQSGKKEGAKIEIWVKI